MPKEVFLHIINNRLLLELFLVLTVYILHWIILLRLGLQANNVRSKINTLFPPALIGTLYSLCGKQFLPIYFFGIGTLIIQTILFKCIGRISFIRAFLTSFSVFLTLIIGDGIIFQILSAINKDLVTFTLTSPLGVIAGTMIELSYAAMVLYTISLVRRKKPLPIKQINKSDLLGLLFFGIVFFLLYFILTFSVMLYQDVAKSTLIKMITFEFILVILFGIIFFLIRHFAQIEHEKKLEEEQIKMQLEESYQLLETLLSERREFRNRLQVVNMMTEKYNNPVLNEYLSKISGDIAIENTVDNIEDPVLASFIISWQIKAKEKDVRIAANSSFSLKEIPVNPLKVTQILNLLLESFIETELLSRSQCRIIYINLVKRDRSYIFEISTSEEAAVNFREGREIKGESYGISFDEIRSKVREAERKISNLGGKIISESKGGWITKFAFCL